MIAVKVAMQILFARMTKLALHPVPLQPLKVEPLCGVAVSVTVAPSAYVPAPVTLPSPVPSFVRVTVQFGGAATGTVKVAVQTVLVVTLTLIHAPGFVHPSPWEGSERTLPVHPVKVEPALGIALIVTNVPFG
jgi:hypothetical protein